jgi:hypothetical protein
MKQRCSFCRKKLGMITFSCKCCEGVFCVAHQTTHAHNCQQKIEIVKETIEKKNPVIQPKKVEAI